MVKVLFNTALEELCCPSGGRDQRSAGAVARRWMLPLSNLENMKTLIFALRYC
ncbi:hypothetical protein [Burkholderia gladioli]|uniref:hypothetical protein n=1 Tax=Burkholderia gladioli TaxID=28095 RepID=UPI001640421B|nr:hypothetical protein [Burkholderia gladioli]